ncbi:hypothetical protein M0805_006551 [Coniferiporia weirii]|nr:hypothetical protein M0805_006551 [Coniferiporia weirii]
MISGSDHAVDCLLRWCNARGIHIDARVCVLRGEDEAISVYARDASIEPGTTLVSIPKTSILSIRNCLLSELITPVIYGIEAQLGLALGLYCELLRGSSSPWFGYLQSLPEHVDIALFWDELDDDEVQAWVWIKGTMAEKELGTLNRYDAQAQTKGSRCPAADIVRQYYSFVAIPALAGAQLEGIASLNGFKRAYAFVSSRAFIVDAYHGLAMVPIADAFNHSLENHVHLESDHGVCPTCGSLSECPHDAEDVDDRGEENLSSQAGRTLSGDNCSPWEHDDTCDMVTNAHVPPFVEVFNTYGEYLTNAQLLVRYGFVLDSNENDIISWDVETLRNFARSFIYSDATNPGGNDDKFREDDVSMFKDRDSDEPVESFGGLEDQSMETPLKAASFGYQDNPVDRTEDRRPPDYKGKEDQVHKNNWGQVLLERLREVANLWYRGGGVWVDSNLVYCPNDQTNQEETSRYGSRGEGGRQNIGRINFEPSAVKSSNNFEDENFGHHDDSIREGQTLQCSFLLNDEAKMSHHLWLFCALLALHTRWFRRYVAENVTSTKRATEANLDTEDLDMSLSGDHTRSRPKVCCDVPETATAASRISLSAKALDEIQERPSPLVGAQNRNNGLLTSPEADVALLKRLARSQNALEGLCANSELQLDSDDTSESHEEVFGEEEANSFTTDAGEGSGTRVVSEEAGLKEEPAKSSSRAIAHGRSAHASARKRARTSSTTSSASCAIEGADDVRAGGRRREEIERPPRRRREELFCGGNPEARLTSVVASEEQRSIFCRRRGDDGISVLLQGYDSEGESTSEAQIRTSEVGDITPDRLNDPSNEEDTRGNQHRKSVPNDNHLPEKEVASGDRRPCGGSGSGFERSDAGVSEGLPDSELGRVVASVADVVGALCATHVRGMTRPDVSAAELGEMIDAIPPTHTRTRTAAQLALAERALLESWAAAWAELGHAARGTPAPGVP